MVAPLNDMIQYEVIKASDNPLVPKVGENVVNNTNNHLVSYGGDDDDDDAADDDDDKHDGDVLCHG
jgi:hypothetical protein